MDETRREGAREVPPHPRPPEPDDPPGRAARDPGEGPGREGGSGTTDADPAAEDEVGGGD